MRVYADLTKRHTHTIAPIKMAMLSNSSTSGACVELAAGHASEPLGGGEGHRDILRQRGGAASYATRELRWSLYSPGIYVTNIFNAESLSPYCYVLMEKTIVLLSLRETQTIQMHTSK